MRLEFNKTSENLKICKEKTWGYKKLLEIALVNSVYNSPENIDTFSKRLSGEDQNQSMFSNTLITQNETRLIHSIREEINKIFQNICSPTLIDINDSNKLDSIYLNPQIITKLQLIVLTKLSNPNEEKGIERPIALSKRTLNILHEAYNKNIMPKSHLDEMKTQPDKYGLSFEDFIELAEKLENFKKIITGESKIKDLIDSELTKNTSEYNKAESKIRRQSQKIINNLITKYNELNSIRSPINKSPSLVERDGQRKILRIIDYIYNSDKKIEDQAHAKII